MNKISSNIVLSNEAETSHSGYARLDAVFGNSEVEILKLQNESVDIICIDPPYLYLKNQKLEREFDENEFFKQCKRVLTENGFLILFGRGVSFYRWNCILADLGFSFKEEIIWDKSYGSSPLMAITRVHETISILTKGNGVIKKVKIPYLKIKHQNIESIKNDVSRITSALGNNKQLKELLLFLETGELAYSGEYGKSTTITEGRKRVSQSISTLQSITNGMNERSIIKETTDRYNLIHPTEKPTYLLERLIQLCMPEKPKSEILVVDFFAGSFSCGEACFNLQINFKGYEIDKEYFELGSERLRKVQFQTMLL